MRSDSDKGEENQNRRHQCWFSIKATKGIRESNRLVINTESTIISTPNMIFHPSLSCCMGSSRTSAASAAATAPALLLRRTTRATNRAMLFQQQKDQKLTMTNFFSTETSSTRDCQKIVVGFVGLGNMGLPMAMNLGKGQPQLFSSLSSSSPSSTFSVIAYDSHTDTRKRAQDMGGLTTASSIEELLGEYQPSTLIMMVPSDSAVNDVMNAVMNNSIKNNKDEATKASRLQLVIDCSTVSPVTSRYWHDQLAATTSSSSPSDDTLLFVDAPVSGGVRGAQDATLTFMVGADNYTVGSRIEPILCQMGQRIVACGGPGSGAAVKLCNNLALAAQMVGIAEAMNLGDALGVDPTTLADVLSTSTAKSWSCEVNNPHPEVAKRTGSPASNDYQGGFGTKLMLKDLSLAVKAGMDVDVALPIGTATKELYQLAKLRGLGDKDFGVILQYLRGR